MKHIIFIFLALSTFFVSGQNNFLGLRGGASFSTISSKLPANTVEYSIRHTFGLSYERLVKNHLCFGADLLYLQRGFRLKMRVTDENGNESQDEVITKFNYNYLSVPLRAGYRIGKTIYGTAFLGLCPSVILDATTIVPIVDNQGTVTGHESQKTTEMSEFDLAAWIGADAGYRITNRWSASVSFAYQYSFNKLSNDNYFIYTDLKNRGMTVMAGVNCAF